MLTCKTLDRFEAENRTDSYTEKEIESIEMAAYVANMNRCGNPEWTDEDVYADFIRVLGIHKITVEKKAEAQESETTENFEIRNNEQFGSLEIYFSGKPDEKTREALKALHFRWHGKKFCWYGFADVEAVKAAISGKVETVAKVKEAKPVVNKFGVKVGDIFYCSWGWEQTNVNFFQVVKLCGSSSVRVREVTLPIKTEKAVSGMSGDYSYCLPENGEILPAYNSSFVEDDENGDLHRLSGKDSSDVHFSIGRGGYWCHPYHGEEVYVSWYA